MDETSVPPDPAVPPLWCDFMSRGLTGRNDTCYYSLGRLELDRLVAASVVRVFIYDDDLADDGTPEILGCLADLEHGRFRYRRGLLWHAWRGWRARPVPGSWYHGPKPAHWRQVD